MFKSNKTYSVIIPTYNEEGYINLLLSDLFSETEIDEIIVVNGNSIDKTAEQVLMAQRHDSRIRLVQLNRKSRPYQMNIGAKYAIGEVIHFIHADSRLESGFVAEVKNSVDGGNLSGALKLNFDHNSFWFRGTEMIGQMKTPKVRTGDDSFFITAKLFKEINGFNEDYVVFEDQDIAKRAATIASQEVIGHKIITSARKFRYQGVIRLHFAFAYLLFLYNIGAGPKTLLRQYLKVVDQDKIHSTDQNY